MMPGDAKHYDFRAAFLNPADDGSEVALAVIGQRLPLHVPAERPDGETQAPEHAVLPAWIRAQQEILLARPQGIQVAHQRLAVVGHGRSQGEQRRIAEPAFVVGGVQQRHVKFRQRSGGVASPCRRPRADNRGGTPIGHKFTAMPG